LNKIQKFLKVGIQEDNSFNNISGYCWDDMLLNKLIYLVWYYTFSWDKEKSLERLSLIVFKQDAKTMNGIINNKVENIIIGCCNAIVCNISLLIKSYYEDKENKDLKEDKVLPQIVGRLMRAVDKQEQQIKSYKKSAKFYK